MHAAATLYELVLGIVLLFAPWTRLWEENWLLWRFRMLEPWVMSGVLRGAVSGLGAAFLVSAAGKLMGVSVEKEES